MRQLPLTIPALAAIGVVLVLAVAGYFAVVAPKRREIARLEQQLKTVTAQAAAVANLTPITEDERARWRTIEKQVRDRFVAPEDQFRVLVESGQLARSLGLTVVDLQLQGAGVAPISAAPPAGPATAVVVSPLTPATPAALEVAPLMFPMPANLAANPRVVRLVARHAFRDLVAFLDRIGTGNSYLALQALDVRRVGGHLESDIRLASLRWVQP